MAMSGVGFDVVEVECGHRCCLYTIHFHEEERTELEKWATDDEINSHQEFDGVFGALMAIPDEGIPDDYFFKREKYSGWVTPFVETGYHELRLYCIKYEDQVWVIAGNGCIKDEEGPLQQFDRCRRTYRDVRDVESRIARRLRGDDYFDLTAFESTLEGCLEFPPMP